MKIQVQFTGMKIVVGLFLLISGVCSAPAYAATYQVNVNGMVCSFCAQGIDKTLRALPQTQDVYINLKQKMVVIETKTGETLTTEKITGIIKDAGYDVASVQEVSGTAQQIKTDMEKL